jgi:hypothetical protein
MVRPVLIAVVVIMPIVIWFSLALQAKRFRDMGWNPAVAIAVCFAVPFLSMLIAPVFPPALALSGLFNLGSWLCLQFWPSAPGGAGAVYDPRIFDENWSDADSARVSNSPAASRPNAAPVAAAIAAPPHPGFGRRGL